LARREAAATVDAGFERAYAWNPRKRQFTAGQRQIAWDVLGRKGWIHGG